MNERRVEITSEVLRRLTVDSQPWLSCDECFERMDQYVEHLVVDPGYVDLPMRTHVAACPACAEEVESLRVLVAPAPYVVSHEDGANAS